MSDLFKNGCSNGNKSWVDLTSNNMIPRTPDRVTPPLCGVPPEEYLKLLREAQRDSNTSSALMSLASTRKNSPHSSPKSPPNSPNNETAEEEDTRGIYVNYPYDTSRTNLGPDEKDWVWDWSSRPDQEPPKDWKFRSVKKKTYSIRGAKVGQVGLFSREVLYTIAITNVMSLILGAGIGIWCYRRNIIASLSN
ncbi:BCL2/adenovirus E1B 19 kDa protein-interacting protein 3-like isoform X2 [Artemia franciscana]|uniref:BCL2/adenovirus E1B 19 kDa protein-interacting protein 3 n=1 Tax=Artemia franciscana TaxID=6661 RepID=A0AA88H8M4_ARTSF|nr:hypothetical protein QYM36_015867 [Artemia franciscana]